MKDMSVSGNNDSKRRIWMRVIALVFLAIALLWLIYWVLWGQFHQYTDDAYVAGNIVPLMPQVAGTVVRINTDDTQWVVQGQTLVELDPDNVDIEFQRAAAALAETVRKVRQLFEKTASAQATVTIRKADFLKAQMDARRRKNLVGQQAVSREEMQHYLTALAGAKAAYQFALHEQQALLAIVEDTQVYTHPLVEQAKQVFRTAWLNKERRQIIAPTAGYIARRSVQVGQTVTPGTSLLAIIPLREVWVDANYKESQLAHLRIGQPVILYADAFPDVTYHGKVAGLSPGTGVSFSLLPPQNATGNWIKIVQRLPVRIELDRSEVQKNPLLIGLSMRVTTSTRDISGQRLSKVKETKSFYATTVYQQQLANANAAIYKILQENSPNLSWQDVIHGNPA